MIVDNGFSHKRAPKAQKNQQCRSDQHRFKTTDAARRALINQSWWQQSLGYSDAGIAFKTQNISSSINWNFYTSVVENDQLYLLIYGKNLPSFSIVPKRAFRNSKDEMTFREMLRKHVDPKLKLSAGDHETYVPSNLQPPDWR